MISVIIPFYNRTKLVERAVNSVFEQTYKDVEIILVDDGSEDAITDEIRDQVAYHRRQHRGAAEARNYGVDMARGDYIAFLDSDDEWLPTKLEKQMGYRFSHTSYRRSDGKPIDSGKFSGNVWPRIVSSCPIATPTVMVHRDILGGKRFPSMKYGEDCCLWIDLAKEHELTGVDEVLAVVNYDTNSTAANPAKMAQGLTNIAAHCLSQGYGSTQVKPLLQAALRYL